MSQYEERQALIRAEKAGGPRRDVVRLAEVAYGALSLPGSLHSRADEQRLHQMWRGLKALDDEQADIKDDLLKLVTTYEKKPDAEALLKGLKALLARKPPKAGRWTKPK